MGSSQFSQNVTGYAERYTSELFKDSGKSGLTPIQLLRESDSVSQEAIEFAKRHEQYQRDNLHSFATWELEESGCFSKEDAKPSDLTYPIAPLLRRRRWKAGSIQIGDGISGVWSAQNHIVWAALKPILRLVSRILAVTPLCLW